MYSRKEKYKIILLRQIKELKANDNYTFYNNPNQFNHVKLERINPNHVGIVWGDRKKKLGKGSNLVKVAKVLFTEVIIYPFLNIKDIFIAYIDSFCRLAYATNYPELCFYIGFGILFNYMLLRLCKLI